MNHCPRCHQPLTEAQVDQYTALTCGNCQGLAIAHPDLAEILERSWRHIPAPMAEATQFLRPAAAPADFTLRCPGCAKPMEKYGYMGLAAVTIDRCDPCARLWLDAEELQNMVLALAKANYRSEARLRKEFNTFNPLQTATSATVPVGVAPNVLAHLDRQAADFQPEQENPWRMLGESLVGGLLHAMSRR